MKVYKRIIFVAETGTCRAPMAAGILKECMLKQPVEILSRGLVVLFPEPLNQKAEAVMISNGIVMENFSSCQFTPEEVDGDTLVLTMEAKQREKVLELLDGKVPEEQVQVLNEVVGDELEILNPYGAALPVYGLCFESINKTIKKLVKILNKGE